MDATSVELSEAMRTRFAKPHVSVGTPSKPWTFADMPGAGGIRSSLADMVTFAKAQINPPQNDAGRAIELAWKKHVDGEPAMGLGWHIAGDGSSRWHSGQTGGFHSMILVNRDLELAVVVLSNTASKELDRLAHDLIQSLAGVQVTPRVFEEAIEVKPEVMRRYVGKYQLTPTFVFTVSIDDNKLMVGVTNQPTLQVFPRSETEWFYKVVDASLTFKLDATGRCTALELFQNGIRQTARRLEKPQ
jgi:CubicO group peptidase (beta-lactamase class C family)